MAIKGVTMIDRMYSKTWCGLVDEEEKTTVDRWSYVYSAEIVFSGGVHAAVAECFSSRYPFTNDLLERWRAT
jgi:hypothetical protein